MRTKTAYVLFACLALHTLFAGNLKLGLAQDQGGQLEVQESREFDDSIWRSKRKRSGSPQKRRKYRRVAVAGSSTTAVKFRIPNPAGIGNSPVEKRKPVRVKPAPLWQNVSLEKSQQVGLTIWRLRKCILEGSRDCFLRLHNAQGEAAMYEAVRVTTEADFRIGDGIQIAIESPISGFIYVVHQEVYKDGNTGDPKLLFPLRDGENEVGPGHPLLIPTQTVASGVKVLKMRNDHGKNLAAERLRLIITRSPMEDIFIQDRPRLLGDEDIGLWESQWAGRLELFDLEGGEKEKMSLNEWLAMQTNNAGSKDLTTEDLAPQKLYVVEAKKNNGVLVTLDLPYR